MKNSLLNRKNKKQLIRDIQDESHKRITCSFYKYVRINNTLDIRNKLFSKFQKLNILGRVYIAKEGINAQISIPYNNHDKLIPLLNDFNEFENMEIKPSVSKSNFSFIKLIIKEKDKIVADGLRAKDIVSNYKGNYLSAKEFNEAMDDPDAIIVDVRNYYESEIGHFQKALCPDVENHRELLPTIKNMLKGKENKKLLLYCTGGIRCEKASAYLNKHNFKNINQLKGGIISYAHQVKKEKLDCKFKGKNFVFDSRMSEEITKDIISTCHQCDNPANTHVNCNNQACHILFIQCNACNKKLNGCCSIECLEITNKPLEEQKLMRKNPNLAAPLRKFQKGTKPRLKDLLRNKAKDS